MVDITIPNSGRIDNIRTFLQGRNPIGMAEDSAKSVLALESACEALSSEEQVKRHRTENGPQLIKPKAMLRAASKEASTENVSSKNSASATSGKSFNANALLIEAFASIRQLLSEGNISELRNQLQLLNVESESLRAKGEGLLDSFADSTDKLNLVKEKLTSQGDALKDAQGELAALEQQQAAQQGLLDDNRSQLTNVKSQLSKDTELLAQIPLPAKSAQQQLEVDNLRLSIEKLSADEKQLNAQTPGLAATVISFKSQIDSLDLKIAGLQSQLTATANQSAQLAKEANIGREQLSKFIETAPRRVEVNGDKWENTLALLTTLTAQLKKTMNESAIRGMKEQEEVMFKVSEASRQDSEKKAKEAEAAASKAESANKAASCASKIFSYVMLAVSVIATVATFGAAAPLTLAVAAIGIAMAVTDIVLEETGNASLMQMLATEISSAVTDMLITFGVPQEEAKKIGSIVGMVVAAIAFLALSLASMSSFVKNIASTAMNVAKTVGKTVVKSALKAIPKSLANGLGNLATKGSKISNHVASNTDEMIQLTKFTKLADKFDEAKDVITKTEQVVTKVKNQSVAMAKLEVVMKGTGAGLSVANSATTGGLHLHAASLGADMKEMLAGMMLNNAQVEAVTELLNLLIKAMSKTYEQFDTMFTTMLTALGQSGQNKAEMLKSARFA